MSSITIVGLLAMLGMPASHSGAPMSLAPGFIKASTTCFSKGEQTSGMNKICYYDCLGSAAAITISAVALCPLTIQQ